MLIWLLYQLSYDGCDGIERIEGRIKMDLKKILWLLKWVVLACVQKNKIVWSLRYLVMEFIDRKIKFFSNSIDVMFF